MNEDEVINRLNHLLDESVRLRHLVPSIPGENSGVQEFLAALIAARQASDRIEEIFIRITRLRARLTRLEAEKRDEHESAWASSVVETRGRISFRNSNELVAPREKYAEADLASLEQKRALRSAERLTSYAKEAYEVVRTLLRGLEGMRMDITSIVKAKSLDSALERQSFETD